MSGLCATWRNLLNSLCQAHQISVSVNFGDAIILCIKLLLSSQLEQEKPRTLKTTKGLTIRRYEILMETMTVTEIIPIVAAKLIYCFLLQIQQIPQQHEDGSCFPLVIYIIHISCRHKFCHVGRC